MQKIVILSGGTGDEREIAIKSAGYFKNNIWKDYDYYELPEQLNDFISNKDSYNLAIPIFHWEYGEDGRIFAMLDILWIPHVLTPYNIHSLLLDKKNTNIIVNSFGYNMPKEFTAIKHNNSYNISEILHFIDTVWYPLIIKPNKWGSSFYTYKIENKQQLEEKINIIEKNISDDLLIQEFIKWEEYSVPIIAWKTIPIMKLEKFDEDAFFDYENKYESETWMREVFPENIPEKLQNELIKTSTELYQYFWVKWYARIDYLVRNDTVYFLEINTIPGMSPASIVPKSWDKTGWSKQELVEKIISDI